MSTSGPIRTPTFIEPDPIGTGDVWASAFESAPIGMLVVRPDGTLEAVNEAFCDALGYTRDELLSRRLTIAHPEERGLDAFIREQLDDAGLPHLTTERRYLRKDGSILYGLLRIVAHRDDQGRLQRSVWQVVDLSEQVDLQRRVHTLSYTDPLTGLPNRRRMHESLDEHLISFAIENRTFVFMLIDLERFKVMNDVLGHGTGDEILAAAAARIASLCPNGEHVGRVGGDEFGVILDDAGAAEGLALAQSIRAAMRAPFAVRGRRLTLGVSIGLACFPDDATTRNELLRSADLAMLRAKFDKTGVRRFVPGQGQYTEDWLATETDLLRSIQERSFEVAVQPVVRTVTREAAYHEALLRWRHRGELRTPGVFMDVAEASGLIVDIDRIMAERVVGWLGQGAHPLVKKVALNLSPISLRDAGIAGFFRDLLVQRRVSASAVQLEVTETALLADIDHARAVLRELRELGLRVAIDDFGAGYASFSLLRRLDFDSLKIDRSIVDGIGRDPVDESVCQGIIRIGHDLGVEVVAEGVEREAQYRWLESLGCDLIQGHYIGMPTPL